MTTVPEGNTVDVSSGVQARPDGILLAGSDLALTVLAPPLALSVTGGTLFTADDWKPERRPRCGVATTHGGVAVILPDTGEMQ